MTISIRPSSNADPDSIKAHCAIVQAAIEHDIPGFPVPTERMTTLMYEHQWPGRVFENYIAWLDGEPVGRLEIGLTTLDNLNNLGFQLEVGPAHRRKGVGKALYAKAVEVARANNRGHLTCGTAWTLPGLEARDGGAGPAFAAALGFASANLPEVMRRFDLSTLDNDLLDTLLEKAKEKSAGYRLIQWLDRAPEEYVADVAYLDGRLVEDAPMGDLVWEPEKFDADRVRETERVLLARDRRTYHTGVVHEESNHLVAWTTLSKDAEIDWHAWQQITIVEPRHRGHRLGALVKVANLRYFLEGEPETQVIDTFNAAENSYMISINEEMGFRPLYAFQNWQRDL